MIYAGYLLSTANHAYLLAITSPKPLCRTTADESTTMPWLRKNAIANQRHCRHPIAINS
jgi:hypothetical protein